MLLAVAGAMYAQSWDTTGNSMLSGTYYFRQIYYVIGDEYGDLSEAISIYGNVSFDGNGNYSITTSSNAEIADYSFEYEQYYSYGTFTATGTYAIAASGYGYITSPYATGDVVYGLVSANGVFVGSSTDTTFGYNDMLVAAPVASPLPTASSFTGSWTGAVFDLSAGTPEDALGLQFTANPDGNGNLNVASINGYAGGSSELYTQVAGGLKYVFSNGAAVAGFPSSGTLMSGQKYFYFSKDGSFMFGGSPITSDTPFDMIVAVKTTATAPAVSGLYYQAGLDNYEGDQDSYFGAFNVIAGGAPQTYLGHQRINDFAGTSVYDYTYSNSIALSGSTYSSSTARFTVGAGGSTVLTSGIGPYLGLSVALQAPSASSTSGITLAGSEVDANGKWSPGTIEHTASSDVSVPGMSAVVLRD